MSEREKVTARITSQDANFIIVIGADSRILARDQWVYFPDEPVPFGLNRKASKRYLAIEVKTLDRVEALVTIVATEDVDSMTIHYATVTASCFVELSLFMGFPCTLLKVKYKNFGRESNLIDATNQIDHLIFVVNKGESRNALVKLRKF